MTCKWTLTLVCWCRECCHTRQKWNLWVCGFVSACCVCVFLSMCLYVCVCVSFHTHICTDGISLYLWRPLLFLFSKFLSFSPFVAGHVHFGVVTYTHTLALTQRLKVISRHFHVHTVAGRHVRCLIRARIVPLPLSRSCDFCMGRHMCSISHAHMRFSASGYDYESKFTFIPYTPHDLSFMSAER